jgi:hypothetical protein
MVLLQFLFETLTDLSVVPSLFLIWQRRRNFELFIGVFQFVASLLYNVCDSLDVELFLDKTEWHKLTNVMGISYGVNVLVFLFTADSGRDHWMKYAGFGCVLVAQIKDKYWMETTHYTIGVILLVGLFGAVKIASGGKRLWALLRKERLRNAAIFGAAALLFFLVSLDDHADVYCWKHGTAQLLFGGCLWNMWLVAGPPAKVSVLPTGAQHML